MISARRGEFETGFERGGQTREHAMLVKTAGVRHLVIVVNKMDDPTVEWEEARYSVLKFFYDTTYLCLLNLLRVFVDFEDRWGCTLGPCSGLSSGCLLMWSLIP